MPDDIHRVRLLIRPMEMLPKMLQKHMRKMLYFVVGRGVSGRARSWAGSWAALPMLSSG